MDDIYYEIEYDSSPIPGVGKFVPKPQKINNIEEMETDETRILFNQMRDIARTHRSSYGFSNFFDRRVQHNNAGIFYKQGMFMKDFTDDYADITHFSQYYPCYQMMGYEQLRTYFTWRTKVRDGIVSDTSLSYAFIYIYELLANIGVDSHLDGLNKLLYFWEAFKPHNNTLDRYVLKWLKDYHIYYELPHSFSDFIEKHDLINHYPEAADMTNPANIFNLFCSVSRYDIKNSAFYSAGNVNIAVDCFNFVVNKLRQISATNGINFDESIFQPTKKLSAWAPFEGALFYKWLKQPDRQVILSANEIYICSQNQWTFSTTITSESGKHLIGYVMKQMEATLRKVTNYKYKISTNINIVSHTIVGKLNEAGTSLEKVVTDAVLEFYREATKTVVKVDADALAAIRQEALATQEKLIIEEHNEEQKEDDKEQEETISEENLDLKSIFTEIEIKALHVILYGEMEIKKFADEHGVMLEVLVDGINEKAMDFIGDNLLDEDFTLYDDYKQQVEELIT